MKQSTLSMVIFGVYMLVMGLILIIVPNPLITLLGFAPVTDVWIRILGMVLVILAFYYFLAVKEEAYSFYRWTSYGRMPIVLVYLGFTALKLAPPILVLLGVFETACAIWTGVALRKESRA